MGQGSYRKQRDERKARRLAWVIVVKDDYLSPIEDWPEGGFAWIVDIVAHSGGIGD